MKRPNLLTTPEVADRLGVDPDRVSYIQGDTDKVTFGVGTGGRARPP